MSDFLARFQMRRRWRDSGQTVSRAMPRLRGLELVLSILMILCGSVAFAWRLLTESNVTTLPRPVSLKVMFRDVRLRAEPATDATVLARVGQGDTVNVDAVTSQCWCRVQTPQGVMWVFCGLLEDHTLLPFEPVSVGRQRRCRRKSDGILLSP